FTTPISQYHRTNPHSHTHSLPTRRSSDLKTQAAAPILDEFDHITKVRNRTDTSIRFETDIDTTIRDFYWNYARDLVKVDTTSERDRKSTRLNSSHVKISYAVFCLKKKTTI